MTIVVIARIVTTSITEKLQRTNKFRGIPGDLTTSFYDSLIAQ